MRFPTLISWLLLPGCHASDFAGWTTSPPLIFGTRSATPHTFAMAWANPNPWIQLRE